MLFVYLVLASLEVQILHVESRIFNNAYYMNITSSKLEKDAAPGCEAFGCCPCDAG